MRRLLIVLSLLLLSTVAWTQDFIRNYPLANGMTFTAPILLPDGSASAPALAFAADPDVGLYRITTNVPGMSAGNVGSMGWFVENIRIRSDGGYSWASTTNLTSTPDLFLARDAANTLALRNGGTAGVPVPQSFNVYNFCDGAACATGYETGYLAWAANAFIIGTTAGGTGTAQRSIYLAPGGAVPSTYSSGLFIPSVDDSYTLGVLGANWKYVYTSRATLGSKAKTLTDGAAAVSFVRIPVPTNANMGGHLIYTATSTDGASGSLTSTAEYNFSGADIAGVVTCGISAQLGVATAYSRANTLLCTVTTVTSTTNCDLQVTCTDNKAAAQTITFNWRLDMPIPNTVTAQ